MCDQAVSSVYLKSIVYTRCCFMYTAQEHSSKQTQQDSSNSSSSSGGGASSSEQLCQLDIHDCEDSPTEDSAHSTGFGYSSGSSMLLAAAHYDDEHSLTHQHLASDDAAHHHCSSELDSAFSGSTAAGIGSGNGAHSYYSGDHASSRDHRYYSDEHHWRSDRGLSDSSDIALLSGVVDTYAHPLPLTSQAVGAVFTDVLNEDGTTALDLSDSSALASATAANTASNSSSSSGSATVGNGSISSKRSGALAAAAAAARENGASSGMTLQRSLKPEWGEANYYEHGMASGREEVRHSYRTQQLFVLYTFQLYIPLLIVLCTVYCSASTYCC
jgi:hypothetical protein